MKHFRYTHTRHNEQGTVLVHDVATLIGTDREVKERLEARLALEDWTAWSYLPNGTHQRTHAPTPDRPYIGYLCVKPMQGAGLR